MADIFISYAGEDRERAKVLAKALEDHGWTVWWDRPIATGKAFRLRTETAIEEAKCVVVLWSKVSIASDWVKEEAEEAKQRQILVPALIDRVDPPLGFKRIHVADLTLWGRDKTYSGFAGLLEAISEIVGPPGLEERVRAKTEISQPETETVKPNEVLLGAASPRAVYPGQEFVARFAAYTQSYRNEVRRVIEQEAPSTHLRLDLEKCYWIPGAKVTIRLDVRNVEVSNPFQTFKWNGRFHVLRFDCRVNSYIEENTIILRFDIAVEGLPIIAIRPEIALVKQKKDQISDSSIIEGRSPKTAFASYAKRDRRDVLSRIRSLQIFTGIDVFLDCLSIRPGEEWKSTLENEIRDRDIFWLFWSRSAKHSPWVEWEWKTALREKTTSGIQPHPLEPLEVAPPPEELSTLQFGAMYEWYISQLREWPIISFFRALWYKWLPLNHFKSQKRAQEPQRLV